MRRVGQGFYQDRSTDTKFAGRTIIVNAGHTPAHNVRFRVKSAILSAPPPEDFSFSLPEKELGGAILGPQQRQFIPAAVDDWVPDGEVRSTKLVSDGKALYIWGIVTYEDVFKQPRQTRLCQLLYWLPDEKATMGSYIDQHNDAT